MTTTINKRRIVALRDIPLRNAMSGVTNAIKRVTSTIPCQKKVKRIAKIPAIAVPIKVAAVPLFRCASPNTGISAIANSNVVLPIYSNWGAGSPRMPNCASKKMAMNPTPVTARKIGLYRLLE